MKLKNGNLLYLFDFDGTLVGSDQWKNLFFNNFDCFRSKVYINPTQFDIRWSILTGRPKIDKWFVRYICMSKGLYPQRIFTSRTWTYKFQSREYCDIEKVNIMKGILHGKILTKFTPFKIEKILYVDNNIDTITVINQHRDNYSFIAVTIKEFFDDSYVNLL